MKFSDLAGEIRLQCEQIAATRKILIYDAYVLLRSYFATEEEFEKYCGYSNKSKPVN